MKDLMPLLLKTNVKRFGLGGMAGSALGATKILFILQSLINAGRFRLRFHAPKHHCH